MSSDRIDFLYKQEKADPEAFLLGRKIEKTEHLNTYVSAAASARSLGGIEGLHSQSVRTELQKKEVGGTMSAEEIEAQRISIDMQSKLRDDPLFLIRKREEEDKREMLKNPLKMMQLQKMVSLVSAKKQGSVAGASSSLGTGGDGDDDDLLKQYLKILQQKNEEKAKKASEMLTKEKQGKGDRRRRRHSSSRSRSRGRSSRSSSSSSSGDELLTGYLNALKQKEHMVHKLKAEDELAEKLERQAEKKKERQRLQPGGGRDDSEEDGGEKSDDSSHARSKKQPTNVQQRHKPQSQQQQRREYDDSRTGHRDDNSHREARRDRDRDRERRSRSRSGSRSRKHRRQSRSHERRRDRRRSRTRSRSPSPGDRKSHGAWAKQKGRKMSPGAMEKKRAEMMAAAQERNVERISNVKRYADEEKKELAEEEDVRKQSKSSFLQGTMLDHADRSTVGDRVQRNKFNVQRRDNDIISGGEKFLKR